MKKEVVFLILLFVGIIIVFSIIQQNYDRNTISGFIYHDSEAGSCQGLCGYGYSETDGKTCLDEITCDCYCDDACLAFGDCCSDYLDICEDPLFCHLKIPDELTIYTNPDELDPPKDSDGNCMCKSCWCNFDETDKNINFKQQCKDLINNEGNCDISTIVPIGAGLSVDSFGCSTLVLFEAKHGTGTVDECKIFIDEAFGCLTESCPVVLAGSNACLKFNNLQEATEHVYGLRDDIKKKFGDLSYLFYIEGNQDYTMYPECKLSSKVSLECTEAGNININYGKCNNDICNVPGKIVQCEDENGDTSFMTCCPVIKGDFPRYEEGLCDWEYKCEDVYGVLCDAGGDEIEISCKLQNGELGNAYCCPNVGRWQDTKCPIQFTKGCIGSCGTQSEEGCWCDETDIERGIFGCKFYEDCCANFDSSCPDIA